MGAASFPPAPAARAHSLLRPDPEPRAGPRTPRPDPAPGAQPPRPDLLATLHLLVALAKHFQPELSLPTNVKVEVIIMEVRRRAPEDA